MKQRRSWDSQGNPIVEVETPDGFARRAREETATFQRLNASQLSLAETRPLKTIGFLPPDERPAGSRRDDAPPDKQLRQRSSLDYLRALSEEIKRRREREGK